MSDHLVSGLYKCEITYLAPASIPCPVVITITRLVLVSPPSDVRLYHGATDVTNSSLGPVQEDLEVSDQHERIILPMPMNHVNNGSLCRGHIILVIIAGQSPVCGGGWPACP